MARPVYLIARDIRPNWPQVYFGAQPYLEAMYLLSDITDHYGCESAKDIVVRFLANASTWRGPVARQIKAELKELAGVW